MNLPHHKFFLLLPFALATYAVEFYTAHNISELARTWTQAYPVLQLLALVNLYFEHGVWCRN